MNSDKPPDDGDRGDEDKQKAKQSLNFKDKGAQTPATSHEDDVTCDDSAASTAVLSTPLPNILALTPGTNFYTPIKPTGYPQDLQRRHVREELYLLAGTSALSLLASLYIILPFTALMSLGIFMTSLGMLGATASRHLRDLIRERGLVDFLPASVIELLTQTSIHEFMVDPTFMMEHRHLALYMMPGVPREQLERYIDRLPQRHRDALRQPGLGWALGGENLMRILVGDERTTAARPPRQPQLIEAIPEEPPVTATPSRRLYDDESSAESDLGLDVSPGDLAGGLSDTQATDLARRIGIDAAEGSMAPSEPAETEEELQAEYASEERILTDAMWSSFYAYFNPFVESVAETAADIARPASGTVMRFSLGLSMASGGLGLLGYWQGMFVAPRMPSRPLSDSIWTTALVGAGTAGALWYARSHWLSSRGVSSSASTTRKVPPTPSTTDSPRKSL